MRDVTPAFWWIFAVAALVVVVVMTATTTVLLVQRRRLRASRRRLRGQLRLAREAERARLARELHDDVAQRVALLTLALDDLTAQVRERDPAFDRRVRGLRAELGDFADEIRARAHRMHPAMLEQLGLPAALRELAQGVGGTAGRARVEVPDGLSPLAPAQSTCLYRIAQEALRNVARHAAARETLITVGLARGGVQLTVEDDGRGFDPAHAGAGLGLTSMAERARELGGRVSVRSRPGEGTRVVAWLPLLEER